MKVGCQNNNNNNSNNEFQFSLSLSQSESCLWHFILYVLLHIMDFSYCAQLIIAAEGSSNTVTSKAKIGPW